MSQHKDNPQCSHDQHLQANSNTQGLEVVQVSRCQEETPAFSNSLIPANSKEAPEAGTANIPVFHQHFGFSSAFAIMPTSSSKSNEGWSAQEEEHPNSSQAAPDTKNVPIVDLDEKVARVVSFLLLKYQTKEPITKEDMLKIVIPGYEDHLPEILKRASECMEMIFGLDVQEVDPINHHYGLLIKLGLTYDGMLSGDDGLPKTGILIVVLGVIFMKGNRATEEELWKFLSLMDIYPGVKHFIFGEPKNLITRNFVKENYLVYQQVENSDPPQFEFLWGPRAHAETTKMKVLQFLARVNNTDPRSFASHYEEALQDEEMRVGADSPYVATATSNNSSQT
ncbi:melanoma-associated antigen B16-like [Talpa occidentalis]|uniref:melanoma-associated antigen B16-like n=1 Tax=Talpa occidentalis TaxID=50954 RepID=UPI0018909951|nr:melanoma-associated antigen B16-like [Talpa occidentalis]